MNILPHQLNGKTIQECYEKGMVVVIEFTDGTKIEVRCIQTVKSFHDERYIDLKLA